MKVVLVFSLILFLFSHSFAQDKAYAQNIINELCSEKYHGRGYAFKGDILASEFIKTELVKFGVKNIGESYFQPFHVTVNTLPSKVVVKINDKQLQPGNDFLVMPTTKSCKGNFQVEKLNKAIIDSTDLLKVFMINNYSNKFVYVDTTGVKDKDKRTLVETIIKSNQLNAKGYIIPSEKLMYRVSTVEKDYSIILVKKGTYSSDINQISVSWKNKFYENYETRNVIGFIQGESDSIIIFGAHYDHLGTMGNSVFIPGANDNGSGVATVLNLAKYYSESNTKPKYSLAFIFFSAEEIGLLGSKYFTEHPLFPLPKVKFMLNLDMVGTGDDGVCIVNGKKITKEFELLEKINSENNFVKAVNPRGESSSSDHYYFYKSGVKAVFMYAMGGIGEYHNTLDKPETLPLTAYEGIFKLITEFVKTL